MPFVQTRLDFDPARDGFSFSNSFRWTEADLTALDEALRPFARPLVAALPALGGVLAGGWRGLVGGAAVGAGLTPFGDGLVRGTAQRWPTFGLCGGMALAASERWPHDVGLPTADLRSEPIRRLLWRRQMRTLRASGATFLRYWTAARLGRPTPTDDLLREWTAIREQIDAGRPAIVGLVGDAPDPFAQHQVLAFGYAGTDERGTLFVYDPNAPGEERTVAFTLSGSGARITTDLPVGPTAGGYHISTRPGHLSMFFRVDA